jgi:hypothetical protein
MKPTFTPKPTFFFLTPGDLIPSYVHFQDEVPPNVPVIMALQHCSWEMIGNIIALMRSTVVAYEQQAGINQPLPPTEYN